MQTSQYEYLKFVRFRDVERWDLKSLVDDSVLFKFPKCRLNKILSEVKTEWVDIKDDFEYPILGVHAQGGGVYINKIAKGKELTMKRYQKSVENALFYCKVRTVNGQWGIVFPEFSDSYGSSNMQYLNVSYDLIAPHFFMNLLKIKRLTSYWDKNAIGADGRHFTLKTLLQLQIPLPTLSEQQALVEAYNSKIKAAEEKERRAEQLNNEIEDYLLGELGIKKQQHTDKADLLLKFVRFKGVEEWGYDKIIGSNFGLLKSNLYDNKKLNELLEINPSTSFLSLNDNDELSFIPMECISDEFGEWKERRKCKKKDSKGYTKFQSGDLIWARITPCMQNGKSAIVDNLESGLGCGSTEFHVLRNKESGLNLQFVHLILRQPMVLDDAKRSFTGSAGQQRVPKSYLENLSIPFPPISIQNAIVEHANQLKEQMKQLKQEAKELRENALVEFEKEIFEN